MINGGHHTAAHQPAHCARTCPGRLEPGCALFRQASNGSFWLPDQSIARAGPQVRVPHPQAMLCQLGNSTLQYGARFLFFTTTTILLVAQYAQILQTYGGGNRVA